MSPSRWPDPIIESVTTLVVGAGQCGLAASHYLSRRSIDHVVLERGEIANSWRHERWDSLRLLTPNWLCRLPGYDYDGTDPDGYLTMSETAAFVDGFAEAIGAPVRTQTTVTSVRPSGDGYLVDTDDGQYGARSVIVASGAYNRPSVPALSAAVPSSIDQLTPFDYKNPGQLAPGAVLVVGASATGVQLAAEIARTGRPVVMAVGEHVRMPRTYRGRDVLWWMDRSGLWDERYDQLDDLDRARRLPSPQLVGTPEHATLNLNALSGLGVELVGRLSTVRDGIALFSGGLRNVVALADLKQRRLLDGFDEWARASLDHEVADPEPIVPTAVPSAPRWRIDLGSGEIGSVIWATGFRPDYRWLDETVLDAKGRLRHDGGAVDSPGLYALGLPVLRRRRSSFINGVEADAREVVGLLASYLDTSP